MKKFAAHKVLGWYSAATVALCLVIFAKLGWVSVICVFLTYFFMSIMFPTIFALGIFGLGRRAKKASSFIVMAIMGGAVLPKVMGAVADRYDLSRGFIVPMLCFAFVALLRLHLAAAEQCRGRGPCFNFGRTLMNASFDLDHAKLAADPRFAAIGLELSALSPINSRESFNRYCREACRLWNCAFPGGIGETEQFAKLLDRIEHTNDGVIRTGWGGVVITLHEHPRVEKYLVVRKGGYLALEMHEQKDERLEIREGAGLILWRPPNERSLTVEVLLPGAEFHFQPGMEHCIIGAEDLLVFERSVDPKGMDQDLIFIYEPDAVATRLPSHAC